jgi:hypothetical protein
MLNQEIIKILKLIKDENPQMFLNPKQIVSMLKDLTKNNTSYNAVIRWLGISLSDYNAFTMIENDYKNNHDFSRHMIIKNLINEGVSEELAKEVVGYWAVLVGFTVESLQTETDKINEIAESGDAESQCELGRRYGFGREGYSIDYNKACYWLEKTLNNPMATSGCKAKAAYYMGMLYYDTGDGEAIKHDVENAVSWLLKAVDGGNLDAMKNLLNILYANDHDCTKGNIFYDAIKIFALKHKNPVYMVALADIYRNDSNNPFIKKWKEFANLYDHEKAIQLCKAVGKLVDNNKDDILGYATYNSLIEIYSIEKERIRSGMYNESNRDLNKEYVEFSEAQLRYIDKSLTLAQKDPQLPPEYFYVQKKIKEAIEGGLQSIKNETI